MAPTENLLERCRNLKSAHAEYLAAKAAHDNFLIVKETNVGSGAKSLNDIRSLLEKVLEEKSAFYRSLPPCQSLTCKDHPKPRPVMLSPGHVQGPSETLPSSSKSHGKRERSNSQNSVDNEGFTLVTSKKAAKSQTLNDPNANIPTANSFGPIANLAESQPQFSVPQRTNKVHSVQVKITNETPYYKICSTIKAAVKGATCRAQGDFIKVSINTEEEQRSVYHCCRDNGFQYLLFTPIKDQPLKVVIKGIPRCTSTADVDVELVKLGYAPSKVVQLKRLRDKAPLPIFQITLPKNEKSNTIYNLSTFLDLDVEVRRFVRPNQVNQCYNCQGWGHSSANCNLAPKCVKCGQDHQTRTCTKSRDTPAVCANCGGDHSANYRNCPAYPKPKPHRNANTNRPSRNLNTARPAFDRSSLTRPNVKYAHAVSGKSCLGEGSSQSQFNTDENCDDEIYMDTENIVLQQDVEDLKSKVTDISNKIEVLNNSVQNYLANAVEAILKIMHEKQTQSSSN